MVPVREVNSRTMLSPETSNSKMVGKSATASKTKKTLGASMSLKQIHQPIVNMTQPVLSTKHRQSGRETMNAS